MSEDQDTSSKDGAYWNKVVACRSKNQTMSYKSNSGDIYEFDVSLQACSKFGFTPGDRVRTPKGPATVIGVRKDFFVVSC